MTHQDGTNSYTKVFLFFDLEERQLYLGVLGDGDPVVLPRHHRFDADARAILGDGIEEYTRANWIRSQTSIDVACYDEQLGHVRFSEAIPAEFAGYLDGFTGSRADPNQNGDLTRFEEVMP